LIKKTALQGIYYWSRFQSDRGIDFNGFLWTRPDGNVLIDPMDLNEVELGAVRAKGGARWILLTNFDHLRDAIGLKRTFGAELLAPAEDRERFGDQAGEVDRWFEVAEDLPAELQGALQIHPLRGGKSPVELALFLRGPGALLFGDLVRSHVSGELMLLPDAKLADRGAAIGSLQPLRALPIRGLLLGDGDCIFYHAKEAFEEFLEELAG
jgi:glyoxylase-like metal-dependent hydrolase (beta-lactamase superfamily II)